MPAQRHYRLDLNRLSMGECLRYSPNAALALWVWLVGRFGLLPSTPPIVFCDAPYGETLVEPGALSAACRAALQPDLDALQALRFTLLAWTRVTGDADPTLLEGGDCWLVSAAGDALAIIGYIEKLVPPRFATRRTVTGLGLVRRFASGRSVTVTNQRSWLDPPPGYRVHFVPGDSPADLLRALDREAPATDQDPPLRLVGSDQLRKVVDDQRAAETVERLRRGVYQPITPEEVAAERERIARLAGA